MSPKVPEQEYLINTEIDDVSAGDAPVRLNANKYKFHPCIAALIPVFTPECNSTAFVAYAEGKLGFFFPPPLLL